MIIEEALMSHLRVVALCLPGLAGRSLCSGRGDVSAFCMVALLPLHAPLGDVDDVLLLGNDDVVGFLNAAPRRIRPAADEEPMSDQLAGGRFRDHEQLRSVGDGSERILAEVVLPLATKIKLDVGENGSFRTVWLQLLGRHTHSCGISTYAGTSKT